MPQSKSRKGRTPYQQGVRVTVCGVRISDRPDLICMLSPTLDHKTHTTLAVDTKDDVNNLVLVYRMEGEDVVRWHSVIDPEG